MSPTVEKLPPVGLPVYLAEDASGDVVVLDGEEGRHAVAVRRHRTGEELVVTDGRGGWARGRVAAIAGKDRLTLDVVERGVAPQPQPRLVVVQALPKDGEEAVELLTAVGVDEIVPWQARRCVTRWSAERAERGLARWRRAAAEAAKQSRRLRLPDITAPVRTPQVAALVSSAATGLICHEGAPQPLIAHELPRSGRIVLVVGPEGGIDDEELAALTAAGGHVVGLGPTVLRSTLAGAVAVAIVAASTGRHE